MINPDLISWPVHYYQHPNKTYNTPIILKRSGITLSTCHPQSIAITMKTPHKQRKLFQNLLVEGLQLFHTVLKLLHYNCDPKASPITKPNPYKISSTYFTEARKYKALKRVACKNSVFACAKIIDFEQRLGHRKSRFSSVYN